MDWIEVTLVTNNEGVEPISELLTEMGSKGVSIEDPNDFYLLSEEQREWLEVQKSSLFTHEDVQVKGYYPIDQFGQEQLIELREKLNNLITLGFFVDMDQIMIQSMGEEDWANAWKDYYFPIRVTRDLTIVPSWISYQSTHTEEKLIILDPGLAFGTGSHPTTQLSLVALEQFVRGGESLLDVGTGSGVLSIAAKALGVKRVYAYDIDQVATRIAKENIMLNPYAKDIFVQENHLLEGILQPADIIIANILAEILILMPKDAYRNLKEDGILILSGIIDSKREEVQQVFEKVGFHLYQSSRIKEWNCLVFTKRGDE